MSGTALLDNIDFDSVSTKLRVKLSHAQFTPRQRADGHESVVEDVNVSALLSADKDHLFVKFYVEEPTVLARHARPNDPVYQDSCVELFVTHAQLPSPQHYINFEMNCIGTVLSHCGTADVPSRRPQSLDGVWTLPSLGRELITEEEKGHDMWTLAAAFHRSSLHLEDSVDVRRDAEALQLCGNLYKCGDGLQRPHWVSAFPVDVPEHSQPQFHVPASFRPLHPLIASINS